MLALKFLWTSKFVFPSNVLKLTIQLQFAWPIRSLNFLHQDDYEKKKEKKSREMFKSSNEVLCDYSVINVNYWMQVDHTT